MWFWKPARSSSSRPLNNSHDPHFDQPDHDRRARPDAPTRLCRRCWASPTETGIVLSSAQELTHIRRRAAHQLFPSARTAFRNTTTAAAAARRLDSGIDRLLKLSQIDSRHRNGPLSFTFSGDPPPGGGRALPPLSEWRCFLSRMSQMAGNRSRLAGKSKRARWSGRMKLRRVAADRGWELPWSATQGARG